MKHLLTLAALLVSTLSLAQFTPYNPDADNDQFVGAQDLLAFLPLFGEDWNLDSLVVYGLSELEPPEWCEYDYNVNNCASNRTREVPADADVVHYDMGGSNRYELILPMVQKPLLILGTGAQQQPLYENYYNSNNVSTPLPNAIYDSMNNTAQAALLIGFQGEWYQIGAN